MEDLEEAIQQADLGGPALEPWQEFLSAVQVYNHSKAKEKWCVRKKLTGQQSRSFHTQKELAEAMLAENPDLDAYIPKKDM